MILVSSLILISLYFSFDNKGAFSPYFTITSEGLVSINTDIEHEGKTSYQLLEKSRLGFIGCWLSLQQTSVLISPRNKINQTASRQLFIFRDSLSEQDYARLISVLRQIRC
jgi:hypothetical protein